jgi:hypothetical protein
MKLMQGSTPSCLDQLVELALIEEQRMLALSEREKRQGSIIPELTAIMKNYAKLLVAIQGMRFDLGIDEYRRGMSAAKKHFEDCEDQAAQQAIIYEAYATAEKILAERFGSEANPAKRSN